MRTRSMTIKDRRCSLYCILALWIVSISLAGCAPADDSADQLQDPAGGSRFGPQILADNFFKDLREALQDPAIVNETTRGKWAEKLANYFAPNERDDQRVALNTSLAGFADGLSKLDPGQVLTLDLRYSGIQKVSDDGERALLRPVNGNANASIYLLIGHTNERGQIETEFEQEISFDKFTGRADGAIPAIRIGERWYLTEG